MTTIPPIIRRDMLKELPEGTVLYYMGPVRSLHMRRLLKVANRSRCIIVVDEADRVVNGVETVYRLKYHNLTCESIINAAKVIYNLTHDPNELPF